MSYCQFMDEALWYAPATVYGDYDDAIHGSDVYVVQVKDKWICACCLILKPTSASAFQRTLDLADIVSLKGMNDCLPDSQVTESRGEMVAHLKKHVTLRHRVPRKALKTLMREIKMRE